MAEYIRTVAEIMSKYLLHNSGFEENQTHHLYDNVQTTTLSVEIAHEFHKDDGFQY
jgi:hypothetical protein